MDITDATKEAFKKMCSEKTQEASDKITCALNLIAAEDTPFIVAALLIIARELGKIQPEDYRIGKLLLERIETDTKVEDVTGKTEEEAEKRKRELYGKR